jgi:G3E family GTPase
MSGTMHLPVTILTGFLGSGKTTLLARLLRQSGLEKTAVIVNEWGEIGLDHELLRVKGGEDAILLAGGCVCCTARSDLADTLRDLFRKRVLGSIPEFDRVIIETTGLADPAPLIHTILADPVTAARYRLGGVVTLISALDADAQMDFHAEAVKQAAMADRLILTKTDLASAEATRRIVRRLGQVNPLVVPIMANFGEVDPSVILAERDWTVLPPDSTDPDATLCGPDCGPDGHDHGHHHHHDHDDGIRTVSARYAAPLDAEALTAALKALAEHFGDGLLRAKGIVHVQGQDQALAIHGVQRTVYPPIPVPSDGSATSRLVFIMRGVAESEILTVLDRYLPNRG